MRQWDVLARLSDRELAHPGSVAPRHVTCGLSHGTYDIDFGPAMRPQASPLCRSKLTAWVRVRWQGQDALPRTVLDEDCNVDDEGSAEFRFQPSLSVPEEWHHHRDSHHEPRHEPPHDTRHDPHHDTH